MQMEFSITSTLPTEVNLNMQFQPDTFVSSGSERFRFSTTEETVASNLNSNDSVDAAGSWYTDEWVTAKMVILSTFPVILVVGTIGNVMTFIVMQRGSLKHSSTCFYMAMLAVADSCVLWSGVLRRIVEEATNLELDIFLWTGCGFGYFMMYFGFNYSSALLVIISVEKFFVLYFPLRTKTMCSVGMARRISLATAILFAAFNSQYFFFTKTFEHSFGKYCYYGNVSWKYLSILFSYIYAILCSYGAFLVMILCNCAIIYKFLIVKWRNRRGNIESTSQALSKSATTGTAMLITISFAFIILTAPICVANAVWPNSTITILNYKSLIALQYMNHGINGILYCIVGSRFRNELKIFLRCKAKPGQSLSTAKSRISNPTSVSTVVDSNMESFNQH